MKKRRLGQHFLFDPSILKRIVSAAQINTDDTVVEIGPGSGSLTTLLAESAKEVIAVEVDRQLCERLREGLSGIDNLELVCGDFLEYDLDKIDGFKAVGNIPYYITTPIIFKLLSAGRRLLSATLTIQKEVAERIVAGPGTKRYGILSLMVQYRTEAEIAFLIPKEAFSPPPKVDSAVIQLRTLHEKRVLVRDEGLFFRIIRTAFSQRRKTLANSLKPVYTDIKGILEKLGIDPRRRPETLTIEDFARISDTLPDVCRSHKNGLLPK